MKRFLIVAFALMLTLSGASLAHADNELCTGTGQGTCPASTETCDAGACVSNDASCNGACGSGQVCQSGKCVASSAGGSCTVDAGCANYGTGWTCQNGTCVAPSTSSGGTNAAGFVPLAPIPGLTSAQGNVTADTIASFLNNLYKYLIGIAAVLAVIMIIWGGVEIAGESVTKKADGKAKIQQAILGLVLVLSPVLVFTIINPAILNLSLNIPALSIEGSNFAGGGSTGTTGGQTCTGTSGTQGSCNTGQTCTVPTGQTQGTCSSATNGNVSGTYLKKLTSSDQSAISSFQSSCTSSGGTYTTSCPTSDTATGQTNCGTQTAECEEPAPQGYTFIGAESQGPTTIFSSTNLLPISQSQLSSFNQFYGACNSDGGKVCVPTGSHLSIGGQVTCPGDPISYSLPTDVVQNALCYGVTPVCADPSSNDVCDAYWSISPHQ